MTQHIHESHANVNHVQMYKIFFNIMPYHATLDHITTQTQTLMQTLKTNTTTVRHP